jgi:hypothetical protein
MKKNIQIVTVPCEEQIEFSILRDSEDGEIIFTQSSAENNPYFEPQQLFVLSDDEIQEGNVCLSRETGEVFTCKENHSDLDHYIDTKGKTHYTNIDPHQVYKIVASYPQIPNTLSISKETVQAWIDAGTPGEVELIVYGTFDGTDSTKPFLNPDNTINLDFGKDVKYEEISGLGKPSIPIEEEMEEKAQDYSNIIEKHWDERGGFGQQFGDEAYAAYKEGYQQALKDLGHIK